MYIVSGLVLINVGTLNFIVSIPGPSVHNLHALYLSVHSSLFFDEFKDRNGVERNRLFISFNYQLTLMEMKAEIRDRIMSHEKPVVAALYNKVYNQVQITLL